MDKKNGTAVTDGQRKAFSELVDHKYNRLINEARDQEGLLVREITEQVRVELGVDLLDNQIEALKNQAEILRSKKSKLGFNEYQHLIRRSKAELLVEDAMSPMLPRQASNPWQESSPMAPSFWSQAPNPWQEASPMAPSLPRQARTPWQESSPTLLLFSKQASSPWQEAFPTLTMFNTQDATLWQESPRPGVCCVASYNV